MPLNSKPTKDDNLIRDLNGQRVRVEGYSQNMREILLQPGRTDASRHWQTVEHVRKNYSYPK